MWFLNAKTLFRSKIFSIDGPLISFCRLVVRDQRNDENFCTQAKVHSYISEIYYAYCCVWILLSYDTIANSRDIRSPILHLTLSTAWRSSMCKLNVKLPKHTGRPCDTNMAASRSLDPALANYPLDLNPRLSSPFAFWPSNSQRHTRGHNSYIRVCIWICI